MEVYTVFNSDLKNCGVISFVGGGGKTTSMLQLGSKLKQIDKKVLITTTTKMRSQINIKYVYYFLWNISPSFDPKNDFIIIFGVKLEI